MAECRPLFYKSCRAVVNKLSFSGMLIILNVFQHEAQGLKYRNQQTELFPGPTRKSLKALSKEGKASGPASAPSVGFNLWRDTP